MIKNRIFLFCILFLNFFCFSYADQVAYSAIRETTQKVDGHCKRILKGIGEFKFGLFRPDSKRLRDVYESPWLNYELSMSYPMWKGLSIWSSLNYIDESGQSLGLQQHRTVIRIIPLTMGMKYVFFLSEHFDTYIGAAMRYFFVRVQNRYPFVKREVHKNGLGGGFVGGLLVMPHPNAAIDIFIDYSLKKFNKEKKSINNNIQHDLDISGVTFGIGIGYLF
jgi:outer membrane protein